jgi:carbamoyltransferase
MGLAPYGEPKYVDLIKEHLLDIKEDGSLKLNMKYFNYPAGLTMTNRHFHKLFGGSPRKPETALTQKDMDIARSIQVVTEEIMIKMANHVYEVSGCENLCLAGGVALNCVGNGKILRETKFKNVWIQPAAGDAGGALGAALFVWYQYLDHPRQTDQKNDTQKGSLLGPSFDDSVAVFIEQNGLVCEAISAEQLPSVVAKLISEENVVGVAQGRMEFGPRALGRVVFWVIAAVKRCKK